MRTANFKIYVLEISSLEYSYRLYFGQRNKYILDSSEALNEPVNQIQMLYIITYVENHKFLRINWLMYVVQV